MTWRDFLPRFRRSTSSTPSARNLVRPHPPLMTEIHLTNALPQIIPTTGRLVSDVNRDYFVLTFDPQYAPLCWDLSPEPGREPGDASSEWESVLFQPQLPLRMADTAPELLGLGDFHLSNTPVVSRRVVELLQPLNIPGLEFFPARIRLPDNSFDDTYSALYLDREIECLDEEFCQFQTDPHQQSVLLERMALNARVLESIELPERLAFRPKESGREYLFHAALVEALSHQPLRGARFVPVQDWSFESASVRFFPQH